MCGEGAECDFLGKRKRGLFSTKEAKLSIFQSFCFLEYPGPIAFSGSTKSNTRSCSKEQWEGV